MSNESGFAGALMGLAIGTAYLSQKMNIHYRDTELALVVAENLITNKDFDTSLTVGANELATFSAWSAPIGLLYSEGGLDRKTFVETTQKVSLLHPALPKIAENDAAEFAAGVAPLVQHEILPEDLMSAVLDFFPPDPANMAVRAGLLVAQDCLEERQTLVDNIEAGDLLDVDLLQVDIRNMERASRVREVAIMDKAMRVQLPPAFYAFAGRKKSFDEVLQLCLAFADTPETHDAAKGSIVLAIALAGAYYGLEAISERWLTLVPNYPTIVATGQRLGAKIES